MSDDRMKPYPGWLVASNHWDKTVLAVIEAEFDAETDQEEMIAKKKLAEEAYMRKLCVMRVASFPVEITIGTTLFGKEFARKRFKLVKDMVKFIFKKISAKDVLKSIDDNM